jgi:Domain of unknown function (DUF2017)
VPARFRRKKNRLVLTLDPAEVEVLRDLAAQLESLFAGGVPERGGDPTRDRLFPRAYLDPTEDEAEAEWQSAVHEDLVRQKSAAVGALVDSLDAGIGGADGTLELALELASVEQWIAALNDVRLALGVVLEVTEGAGEVVVDPEDPRAPGFGLYDWLTWLQGSLVEELLGDMEATGDDDE